MSPTNNFCCAHSQQRIDSPEPPARVPAIIDGIFAAAALPEDHPHALEFPEKKKPELDASIVRSPGIADKILQQFHRPSKSMRVLRRSEVYDEDARALTSQEVFQDVACSVEGEKRCVCDGVDEDATDHRFGSVRLLSPPVLPAGRELGTDVRPSVLGSLEWLRPLLQQGERPSEMTMTGETEATDIPLLDLDMPLSASSPNLLVGEKQRSTPMRRTQSFLGLSSTLKAPSVRARTVSANSVMTQSSLKPVAVGQLMPEPSRLAGVAQGEVQSDALEDATERSKSEDASKPVATRDTIDTLQSEGIHLHTMDISQQLRSLSQLSDPTETDSLLSPDHAWNFHRRERSDIGGFSVVSRHSHRRFSAVGEIGRVMSPAASSVYSQHSGATGIATTILAEPAPLLPYEVSAGLDGPTIEWPLQPPQSPPFANAESEKEGVTADAAAPIVVEAQNMVSTPAVSFATAPNNEDLSSPWQSTPARTASQKSSSSVLTKDSRLSRLFGRSSSPPKKAVRKRRSIFRFLRPGSRKQTQTRSISTPVLRAESSGVYDGPADDLNLLTVQYKLREQESKAGRSASMSHLGPERANDPSHLTVQTNPLQRRASLVDYERNLTAQGDDRRRRSSVNVHRLPDVQENEHHAMHPHRLRKLSRAKPLSEDEDTGLMAQALEKHQQEKALFRSASKQREREALLDNGSYSVSTRTASSPNSRIDLRDPLDTAAGPSYRVNGLLQPDPRAAISLEAGGRKISSAAVTTTASAAPRPNRIGTSLASWSRYPSHTRVERCGPAGHGDEVITRDFAVHVDPEELHITDETVAEGTPVSGKSAAKGPESKLPKSRSATFGNLLRYYSNLLTTGGSTAQNRRTSVTMGGWLDNPDLEMLPASPSSEHGLPHHDHHFRKHLHQLKEHMMQEVDKLEKEVGKEVKEAEKLMLHPQHHPHQHNQEQGAPNRGDSPFRQGSIFRTDSHSARLKRERTVVDPMDSSDDNAAEPESVPGTAENAQSQSIPAGSGPVERSIQLDGAAGEIHGSSTPASKADVWSALYKECLIRPASADTKDSNEQHRPLLSSDTQADRKAMPPPALKPIKPRSPENPKTLDPKASIRRFPSVTVVDDRKGHSRSVSLISVKVDRDGGIVRSSTNDLLRMMEMREREEREKLLAG